MPVQFNGTDSVVDASQDVSVCDHGGKSEDVFRTPSDKSKDQSKDQRVLIDEDVDEIVIGVSSADPTSTGSCGSRSGNAVGPLISTASPRLSGDRSREPSDSGATSIMKRSRSKSPWDHAFLKSGSMVLSEIWNPVPTGLAIALNIIKDLKQSVTEVMRLFTFEFVAPLEMDLLAPSLQISVEGPSARRCRRWKPYVFNTFSLSLSKVMPGIWRTKETNSDCRVSRLARRSNQLKIVARIFEKSGKKASKEVAKLIAKVPFLLGSSGNTIVHFPLVKLKNRRSRSRSDSRAASSNASATPSVATSSQQEGIRGFVRLSVLEAFQVFDVKRCRPNVIRALGHDEWRPSTLRQWKALWRSPFNHAQLENPTAVLSTMTTDMKHDIILMYQTLFSQSARISPAVPELSDEAKDGYDKRVLFLKRLYLCFAVCKLTYCIDENGAATHAWPFPLASALCHGSRILIRLDGVRWQDFSSFLLLGDPSAHSWDEGKPPSPMWARWAATHSIGLNQRTSQLYERKLTKRSVAQNVSDGVKFKHLGLDLPIGGFGNQAPTAEPLWVGPDGRPFRKIKEKNEAHWVDEIQHGHLYFRWDDFGLTHVPVLHADGNAKPQDSTFLDSSVSGTQGLALNGTTTHGKSDGQHSSIPEHGVQTLDSAHLQSTRTVNTSMSNFDGSVEMSAGRKSERKEHWLQLPHLNDVQHLDDVLREHGYDDLADSDGHKTKLYKHVMEENELTITANHAGTELKIKGVVIHLVLEMEEDGVEKVLIQSEALALRDPDEDADFASVMGVNDRGPQDVSAVQERPFKDAKSVLSLVEEAGPDEATHKVEDRRVPTMLRRRHESWTEAVTRICQGWNLSQKAIGIVIDQCREAEEEMCIYKCPRPVSHCHHHGHYTTEAQRPSVKSSATSSVPFTSSMPFMDASTTTEATSTQPTTSATVLGKQLDATPLKTVPDSESLPGASTSGVASGDDTMNQLRRADSTENRMLEIEYQAYRFKFVLKPHHRHHFSSLFQDQFHSAEKGVELHGFDAHPPGTGTIWRKWEWMPRTKATMHGCEGLYPPADRLRITRETDHLSAILLGIENSAPHKENFFGGKHTAAATVADTSPFGTRKWKDYRRGGQEVPADIGGMHVSVDKKAFKALQILCNRISLSRPSQGYQSGDEGEALRAEKDLFKELLQSSDEEISEVLHRRLRFTRPVLHGHAGTLVFDAFVRDRTEDEEDDEESSQAHLPATKSAMGLGSSGLNILEHHDGVDMNITDSCPETLDESEEDDGLDVDRLKSRDETIGIEHEAGGMHSMPQPLGNKIRTIMAV